LDVINQESQIYGDRDLYEKASTLFKNLEARDIESG
jgi:hypothetical protein